MVDLVTAERDILNRLSIETQQLTRIVNDAALRGSADYDRLLETQIGRVGAVLTRLEEHGRVISAQCRSHARRAYQDMFGPKG
ncbi:hypothetical protein [Acetobacter sp. DsW_063]|uniref:hypothetical protein n=1 Tax=Acetobacter sp. DsW_063 TaxID=1514894 RepID=UPI000B742865|nr:hypothetical protein [Acetobacter sp. DsW_063]OUJ17076.1 hypothetical protein HK28_07865 [Acetobacter sp. DsW_063]